MIDKITSFLEFMGAVNFAFIAVDSFNNHVLKLRSNNQETITEQIESLRRIFKTYEKKANRDLTSERESVELTISIAQTDLENCLKQASFKGLALISGFHCIFFLGLFPFVNYFGEENLKGFLIAYCASLSLFMTLFFQLEQYKYVSLRLNGAFVAFFLSIFIGVILHSKLLFVNNYLTKEFYSFLILLIPTLPILMYFIKGLFFKQKELREISTNLANKYISIYNKTY